MTPPADPVDPRPEVLLHFSEDPGIERFDPHEAATAQQPGSWVWAVDRYREPTYWFPRNCPRITFWPHPDRSVTEGQRAVLGWTTATKVSAIEAGWLERMRACRLYVYSFDPAPFVRTEEAFGLAPDSGGFWVAAEPVQPVGVEPVGDLLAKHVSGNVELRVTPSLWDLWDQVVPSGLAFSGIRLRNAVPRPG